mgnify:CR=1 FL=1
MRAMQYWSSRIMLGGICGSCIARKVASLFYMTVYSGVCAWRHAVTLVACGGWGV